MDGGFRPIVPSCLSFVPQPSISSSRSPFFLSNASFSYPVNLLFLPCIPVFFFFTPNSPQIGPHRKRIATSRFSSVFPPFPLKCPIFTLFLSNNVKSYLFSQTFLSKHLEGIKKRRTFAPAFPNKAYAEKGRAIKTSDL